MAFANNLYIELLEASSGHAKGRIELSTYHS
jgi:hypothetical protein